MRIVDKTIKIKNYRLHILFTHFSFWRLRHFKIFGKRSFLRYGFSIVLLGFQLMITINKEKREISVQELKQIIKNGVNNRK